MRETWFTSQHRWCDVATNAISRPAALRCNKDQEGRPCVLLPFFRQLNIMQADEEATAVQIRSYLLQQSQRLLSLSTILHVRRELGWTYRGSAYCQLIRQANKEKRLEWARAHLHDNFEDVLWTDESSVQLECHKRFCCRKEGEQPRP